MAMGLARENWIEAALGALARDGLRGVAVEPLARQLATTKGSFYWHFADRSELIQATLELWERRDTTELIAAIEAISGPRERLAALVQAAYTGAAHGNAQAAVVAAAADPRVRPVLTRVTRTRLRFLERLYRDLGLAGGEAARHARLTFALYLGLGALRIAAPETDSDTNELEQLVELAFRTIIPTSQAVSASQQAPKPEPRARG
jgi:AcrR family transcriptional regulator